MASKMKRDGRSFPYEKLGNQPAVNANEIETYQQQSGDQSTDEMSFTNSRATTAIEEKRQKLMNEDDDSIRVVIRVRPPNELEKSRTDSQAVYCAPDRMTVQVQPPDNKPKQSMTFNRIFGAESDQQAVFEECGVKRLVEKAVSGYNATCFAYGQTGAGKTHTITGPDNIPFTDFDNASWGVIPKALRYLFDTIEGELKRNPETRFTVKASFLEIYNEQVMDLLNPTTIALPVRYDTEKGFFVENLFVVECEVLDDCMAVVEEGLHNRRVASHRLNERSSRSHSIMTIHIHSEIVDPDDQRLIRKSGKISFVDLAGSEKIKESKAEGKTLTETLNINKSLLTLGICISALADMKKKKTQQHVPYRDSKLTKLLGDTLGGNGLALMVACVSPVAYNMNETLSTLRYASRAKYIQNKPVVQIDPREELIMKLKQELKEKDAENLKLRKLVASMESGAPTQGGGNNNNSKSSKTTSVDSEVRAKEKQMLAQLIDENRALKTTNDSITAEKQKIARENHYLIDENVGLISKIEKLVEVFGSALDKEIKSKKSAFSNFFGGGDKKKKNETGANARLTILAKKASASEVEDDVTAALPEEGELYMRKRVLLNALDFAKRKHIDKSISDLVFSEDESAPRAREGFGDLNTESKVTVVQEDGSQQLVRPNSQVSKHHTDAPQKKPASRSGKRGAKAAAGNNSKQKTKEEALKIVDQVKAEVQSLKLQDRPGKR